MNTKTKKSAPEIEPSSAIEDEITLLVFCQQTAYLAYDDTLPGSLESAMERQRCSRTPGVHVAMKSGIPGTKAIMRESAYIDPSRK